MTILGDQEIEQRLTGSSWKLEGGQIEREWSFENFERAIEFIDRVAAEAEIANHHPDILLHSWNKVKLSLSTHSQGGLTDADFALAARIDPLADLFS